MTMTSNQCLAARMLADVDRDILCELSGVDHEVLAGFEHGRCTPGIPDVAALQLALEALGVEFVPEMNGSGVGVALKFNKSQTAAISAWEGEGGEAAQDSLP